MKDKNYSYMNLTPVLPPEQEAIRQRAFHPTGVWTPLDTIIVQIVADGLSGGVMNSLDVLSLGKEKDFQ